MRVHEIGEGSGVSSNFIGSGSLALVYLSDELAEQSSDLAEDRIDECVARREISEDGREADLGILRNRRGASARESLVGKGPNGARQEQLSPLIG